MILSILIALLTLPSALAANPITTIKLFTWWDYTTPAVVEYMKSNGFKIDATEYRSNDVAVARLGNSSGNFDVSIVSNAVIGPLLAAGVFERNTLTNVSNSRPYEEFLKRWTKDCVPYMWSASLFAYDSRASVKPPDSIGSLIALQNNGFGTFIIDDPLELLARLIADDPSKCGNKLNPNEPLFSSLNQCKGEGALPPVIELKGKNFVSSVGEKLSGERFAIYGWHGEVASIQADNPWIKYSLPKSNPIIGVDLVCINKQRKSPTRIQELTKFVALMTDQRSTKLNIDRNQYFSPYKNDMRGLLPSTKELRVRLGKLFKVSQPIFFEAPEPSHQLKVSKWWQEIRYAK